MLTSLISCNLSLSQSKIHLIVSYSYVISALLAVLEKKKRKKGEAFEQSTIAFSHWMRPNLAQQTFKCKLAQFSNEIEHSLIQVQNDEHTPPKKPPKKTDHVTYWKPLSPRINTDAGFHPKQIVVTCIISCIILMLLFQLD